ncbi:MAG: hypothetical protein ABI459_08075, partial [Deltaproteobacteria bacterium]
MALASFSDIGVNESPAFPPKDGVPVVSNTHWGYVVRPAEDVMARSAVLEMAAMFGGVFLYMFAIGQWLLPGSLQDVSVLPMKIMLTVLPMGLGLYLITLARHGLVRELQLDWVKGELRFVMRNRLGVGRLARKMPFREVARIMSATGQGRQANLVLHLSG